MTELLSSSAPSSFVGKQMKQRSATATTYTTEALVASSRTHTLWYVMHARRSDDVALVSLGQSARLKIASRFAEISVGHDDRLERSDDTWCDRLIGVRDGVDSALWISRINGGICPRHCDWRKLRVRCRLMVPSAWRMAWCTRMLFRMGRP